MPVTVRKRGKKFRVVEKASGRIAKTNLGNAKDGGGQTVKVIAERQARAINEGRKKKRS